LRDYDYRYETDEGTVRLGAYRNAFNAYVRWSFDDRSGELGGLTEDGMLVLDIQEYVRSNGDSETVALPDEAVERLEDDLAEIRNEIGKEMTDDEKEAFEDDKRIILRAREILDEEGAPRVESTDVYAFEREDGHGNVVEVRVTAEPRDGVAELAVETKGVEGYSPKYDLSEGVMSLPVDDWGISREIEVPDGIADSLLEDLRKTQEQLNERREAYHDAVRRAREEVVED
jgi:hypothetical protein